MVCSIEQNKSTFEKEVKANIDILRRIQQEQVLSADEEKKIRELLKKEKQAAKLAAEAEGENDLLGIFSFLRNNGKQFNKFLAHEAELLTQEIARLKMQSAAEAKMADIERENRDIKVKLEAWSDYSEESERFRFDLSFQIFT